MVAMMCRFLCRRHIANGCFFVQKSAIYRFFLNEISHFYSFLRVFNSLQDVIYQELAFGAENEIRTRDPQLGKLMLYQLSYFRLNGLQI